MTDLTTELIADGLSPIECRRHGCEAESTSSIRIEGRLAATTARLCDEHTIDLLKSWEDR